jgi:hypothetical protein
VRKALVVGINNYPNIPLNGSVNDAVAIAQLLERNGNGDPNFDIKLITAPNAQITRASLRKDIEKLFSGSSDVALFYFSGHGFLKSTGGYIVTQDFTSYDEGISMDELLVLANKSQSRDKVIILDTCHSGAVGSPAIDGSNIAKLSEGLTVLTASSSHEYALEKNGQGIFTSLLIDGLQGGAADLRGNVTPGSIYAYVDEALGAWDQRPIFKSNVSRFTVLRRVPPTIPIDVLRRLCLYFPNPTDEYSLDPSYEDTEPTANPVHIKIFKELQKYFSIGLVRPIGEEYMYFAAINNKSCKLTALGYQYWRLASEGKL